MARVDLDHEADGSRSTPGLNAVRAPNVHGLEASPLAVSRCMPIVRGNCPACGLAALFLASGGYVTCASLQCPKPDAASDVLAGEKEGSESKPDLHSPEANASRQPRSCIPAARNAEQPPDAESTEEER